MFRPLWAVAFNLSIIGTHATVHRYGHHKFRTCERACSQARAYVTAQFTSQTQICDFVCTQAHMSELANIFDTNIYR